MYNDYDSKLLGYMDFMVIMTRISIMNNWDDNPNLELGHWLICCGPKILRHSSKIIYQPTHLILDR